MTFEQRVRRFVDAAPPGALVTVESLATWLGESATALPEAHAGLTLEEVAERFAGASGKRKPTTAAVRKWIRDGHRGVRLAARAVGRSYRVSESQLAAFLAALEGPRPTRKRRAETDNGAYESEEAEVDTFARRRSRGRGR